MERKLDNYRNLSLFFVNMYIGYEISSAHVRVYRTVKADYNYEECGEVQD